MTNTRSVLFRHLLVFARLLRELGIDVHTGRLIDALRAVDWIGIRRRRDLHGVLRTVLVHREGDLAIFDRAFDAFWRAPGRVATDEPLLALGERPRVSVTRRQPKVGVAFEGLERVDASAAEAARRVVGAYSSADAWRQEDFATFTPEELEHAKQFLAQLRWEIAPRRTRRWEPGRGRTIDLRRAARRNMRYGGELVILPRRMRRDKPRPLVILCDVSGSMERYTRMLLHFIHAVTRRTWRVEAFLFATTLTRITRSLSHSGVDEAIGSISTSVPDWAGGTRIGEALRAFNLHWARVAMRNGAVVLLISDGWDCGDPRLLAREAARLQRTCRRLIWLNPLLGSATYEPLTRGMQAALPFVDDFLPVHNLVSLEALAQRLSSLPPDARAARRRRAPVPAG